jgi:hypothetical protein
MSKKLPTNIINILVLLFLLSGCGSDQAFESKLNTPVTITSTPTQTLTPTPKYTITPSPTPTPIGGSSPILAFVGKGQDGNVYLYVSEMYSGTIETVSQLVFDENNWNPLVLWSPDGSKLLFKDTKEATEYFYIYDYSTKLIEELTNLPKNMVGYSFVWSDDAKYVLFWSANYATHDGGPHMIDIVTKIDNPSYDNPLSDVFTLYDLYNEQKTELQVSIPNRPNPQPTFLPDNTLTNLDQMFKDYYRIYSRSPDGKDLVLSIGTMIWIVDNPLSRTSPEGQYSYYATLNEAWFVTVVNSTNGKDLAIYKIPDEIEPLFAAYFASPIIGFDISWH